MIYVNPSKGKKRYACGSSFLNESIPKILKTAIQPPPNLSGALEKIYQDLSDHTLKASAIGIRLKGNPHD